MVKHWTCVALIFVFYPITVYSQTSLYQLSTADTSIGLALSKQDMGIAKPKDTTTIRANLDYGVQDDLKISFQVGVGLTDPTNVPPAPIGQIGIVQVKPLGDTGLQYFWNADLDAVFFRIIQEPTNQVLERTRLLGLSGGAGVLKHIETESGQVIKPFFALSYTRFWENLETNVEFDEVLEDLVFKQTKDSSNFAGEIGVEIELSPTMTALGGFKFSFESSDVAFRVGLNFY